jgi:16S rRNA (cytosine967-C5)-methyltransferase
VELLDVHPGERILDACAAPGGKAVQIAWRGASLTACEVNPNRRRRLEENLSRLNLKDVKVISDIPQVGDARFDKVLVDAPCSNTGVFRRRPDARWNWSEEKMLSLVELQSSILEKVAPLVSPGGILVYSTCSNEVEENLFQVKSFLAKHKEFSLSSERESLPFQTNQDGAYAAAFIPNGD